MSRPSVSRLRVCARALVVFSALMILAAATAHAAVLITAELEGDFNYVTVEQGQTVTFPISLSAIGTIRCTATRSNPATAKVDTKYAIDGSGTATSNTLSAALPFYADPFCGVTWPGDPTAQLVTASLTANINTPVGDYAFPLHTQVTTPGGSGSALRDDTPTVVTFHVVPGTDQTPPVVSCGGPSGVSGSNGWYTSQVSVGCTSSDDGSGLADASDGSFALATVGDGVVSTPSRTVADNSGNTTTVGPFGPFKIDTVAPSVGCGSPSGTLGSGGWYTSEISVACTATDTTSGLASASDASFTLATSGEGTRSIGARSVTDVAGNTSSTGVFGPFKIDTVAPSVGCGSPSGTLGSGGWYTSDVSVVCTASDATSGLAVPDDASFTLATSGEGSRSIDAHTVTDVAGNGSSTGGFGPFNVDLFDPTIAISSPVGGATFVLGSPVSASFSCGDTVDGSGVDTCVGSTADGSALNTGNVGAHTFSVTAVDHAGRATTVSQTYSVVYAFGQAVTPGGRTSVRAGSAVPVWFSLGGISDMSAVRAVTSAAASCDGSGSISIATPVAMNGGLRYDASSDRFSFVWKTDRSWAGSCRLLEIGLNDGTTHTLMFDFR